MKALVFVLVGLMALAAAPARAEFFRYVDGQGRVRYTDDINQVPEAQRGRAKSYAESKSPSAPGTPVEEAAPKQEAASPDAAPKPEAAGPDAAPVAEKPPAAGEEAAPPADETRAQIEALRKELDSEFQALTAEKAALAKEKETRKSREEITAFNKKIEAFNQRAERYEQQGGELKRLVHEYNVRLAEESGKALNTK